MWVQDASLRDADMQVHLTMPFVESWTRASWKKNETKARLNPKTASGKNPRAAESVQPLTRPDSLSLHTTLSCSEWKLISIYWSRWRGWLFCDCVRGHSRMEAQSWEPFTQCVEIRADKCMRPCFFPSLLFSPRLRASVCIPSAVLPVSSSISFCFVPWLPCGHSVSCVCLSPSAICFPDRGRDRSRALTHTYKMWVFVSQTQAGTHERAVLYWRQ